MANWSRDKVDASNLNNGQEYTIDSDVSIEQLNSMVNSGLYSQDFVEALTDTPEIDNSNPSAGISVEFVDNIKDGKVYKKFKFNNIQSGSSGGNSDIKLYSTTGQNTDGAMTQKAVTDKFGTVADKTLMNIATEDFIEDIQHYAPDVVIDYYRAGDGSYWFRNWASGWKECGGTFIANGGWQTITLPISFSNTNYKLLTSFKRMTEDAVMVGSPVSNKTVSSFRIACVWMNVSAMGYSDASSGGDSADWYACGY